MPALPLAVEIADAVSTAREKQWPLDVEATADHLLRAHPEAEATRADIADTLRAVSIATGVMTVSGGWNHSADAVEYS